MGETTVTTLRAMDAHERQGGDRDLRFASIAQRTVVILADWQGRLLSILALVLGAVAWVRVVRHLAAGDAVRFVATLLWGVLAGAGAVAAMLGASWLLTASSTVHHPWYASPLRTCALIVISGALGTWLTTRAAFLAPERVRYRREPATAWAITLPIWGAIVAVFEATAPLAAPLWALALALAGAALMVVPPARTAWMRAASLLVLSVTVVLFVADGLRLFEFLVAVLGRLPIVTPVWVLPLFVAFIGVMIAAPLAAGVIGFVEGRRSHGLMGAALLVGFAATLTAAYVADAYTWERPARRSVVYVHDAVIGRAWWEVGGNEPGLDLAQAPDRAARWSAIDGGARLPATVPVGGATGAFRFRRAGEPTPAPARVLARQLPAADASGHVDYEVAVTPQRPGLSATLHLPPGVVPVRATPAGVQPQERWRATYLAIPREGMTFRARIPAAATPSLATTVVVVGSWMLPGADARRMLPWLPQDRADWTTYAQWVVTPESAAEVPVEATPEVTAPPPGVAPAVPPPSPPPPSPPVP
jgi:hypothetical protein